MELLIWNRKILTFFGLCALPKNNTQRQRLIQITVALIEFLCLLLYGFGCFLYCVQHYPPFNKCVLAFAAGVGEVQTAVGFVSLFFRAKQVRSFFDQVQQLYEESEQKLLKLFETSTHIQIGLQFIRRRIDRDRKRLSTNERIL